MVRAGARFLLALGLVLALLGLAPFQRVLGEVVGSAAARVLGLAMGRPVLHVVKSAPVWSLTEGRIGIGLPGQPSIELQIVEHVRNLALFVSIVVAVATVRGGRLLLVLGVGSGIVLLLDALIVAAEAWEHLPGATPSGPVYQGLRVLETLHGSGGMFVAPVFLGAAAACAFLRPTGAARRHGFR